MQAAPESGPFSSLAAILRIALRPCGLAEVRVNARLPQPPQKRCPPPQAPPPSPPAPSLAPSTTLVTVTLTLPLPLPGRKIPAPGATLERRGGAELADRSGGGRGSVREDANGRLAPTAYSCCRPHLSVHCGAHDQTRTALHQGLPQGLNFSLVLCTGCSATAVSGLGQDKKIASCKPKPPFCLRRRSRHKCR
eukprot:6209224-Pleurochrysis_carterae.AAC.2